MAAATMDLLTCCSSMKDRAASTHRASPSTRATSNEWFGATQMTYFCADGYLYDTKAQLGFAATHAR
jgi:hypothetical protein